jgi:hypothetical protein
MQLSDYCVPFFGFVSAHMPPNVMPMLHRSQLSTVRPNAFRFAADLRTGEEVEHKNDSAC